MRLREAAMADFPHALATGLFLNSIGSAADIPNTKRADNKGAKVKAHSLFYCGPLSLSAISFSWVQSPYLNGAFVWVLFSMLQMRRLCSDSFAIAACGSDVQEKLGGDIYLSALPIKARSRCRRSLLWSFLIITRGAFVLAHLQLSSLLWILNLNTSSAFGVHLQMKRLLKMWVTTLHPRVVEHRINCRESL